MSNGDLKQIFLDTSNNGIDNTVILDYSNNDIKSSSRLYEKKITRYFIDHYVSASKSVQRTIKNTTLEFDNIESNQKDKDYNYHYINSKKNYTLNNLEFTKEIINFESNTNPITKNLFLDHSNNFINSEDL